MVLRRRTPLAPSPTRPRNRAIGMGVLVLLVLAAAACEPAPVTAPPVATPALDTFATSTAPTSGRANDVALRIMDSQGKTKVGYLSFPVPAGTPATTSGTLGLTPVHAGFALQVHDTGPVSASTTFSNRPALGATVGRLGRTGAGARVTIPIAGARVVGGRVNLAITTTSPYELEIVSLEGARSRSADALAPTFTVGATSTPTTPPPPTTTPQPDPSGWRLTFADEFDGTAVDRSTWHVYDEARGDAVESPKTSTCPKASNVSVTGGKLVMRTQKARGTCAGGQAQSGAGLNTFSTFRQAGGRYEARARWTDKGNYLWGGFWTHGNLGGPGWSKDNPTEIDVFEYIGKVGEPNINRFKPAIHYNYTCSGTCGMQNMPYMGHDVTQWHTYAVEWEPTNPADPTTMQIRFYVDDVLITVFDKHGTWQVSPGGARVLTTAGGWENPKGPFPNPFGLDRPHQLILSAWVGAPGVDAATVAAGYRPAAGHADLEVDYVRVYQR